MNLLASMRYLVALSEHRHFGRAAEACHITQPALSNVIPASSGLWRNAQERNRPIRVWIIGWRTLATMPLRMKHAIQCDPIG